MKKYIIDVRSIEEYQTGHYEGAICHDIRLMMEGVLPDIPKDACIEVYCNSGNRSRMACLLLQEAGFSHVIDRGGYRG